MSKHDKTVAAAAENTEKKPVVEEPKPEVVTHPTAEPEKVEPVPTKVEEPAKKDPEPVKTEPKEPEQPKVIKPVETVKPEVKKVEPTIKIDSAVLLAASPNKNNVFAARRAMNAVNENHSMLGKKLITLFADYKKRMSTPTKDRDELKARIKMLQTIVNTACPTNQLDMQTATDVVRVMFDCLMEGWGTVYTDSNIFAMGNTLKGTAYELDKMVVFVEAFIQMIEAVSDKNVITFSEERLAKVVKNPNVVTAVKRIRDNINKRNGFSAS